MYVEFKNGEKFSGKESDMYHNCDSFMDAGRVIEKHEIIVDIDCLDRSIIEKIIEIFNIKTMTVWTDRGAHLYFKNTITGRLRNPNRICALGFPIELKTYSNTKAVTIKRGGLMRDIENESLLQDLPLFFSTNNKDFENMIGLDDSEGRNNKLFTHRVKLNNMRYWEKIINFINEYLFSTPIDPSEMEATVLRELEINDEQFTEPKIAEYMINLYKIVKYAGEIHFKKGSDYTTNRDILVRELISYVGDKPTKYIDEVLKQIEYRAPMIDDDNEFDIKLKNGILRRGRFIEVDYEEFTPYNIDVIYNEDAPTVKIVDDYIDHLTQSNSEYRKLLFEVLGHTLIVDKEVKRVLAKFFIFVGGGGNGKGTLLQVIKKILNSKNCTSHSISNMQDERYSYTMLGKLANLGDDIQDQAINHEQMKILKNISSCDNISMRALYKQSKDVQLTTTLIFTSNHILKSFEKGESYKRRVLWLPMFSVVKKEERSGSFISSLTSPEALEYWMKLIVEGYNRLYTNLDFTQCDVVDRFNGEYHLSNNTTLMFLEDYSADDIEGRKLKELMNEYELWCEENSISASSKKMLEEAIQHQFGLTSQPKKISGKTMRVLLPLNYNQ